MAKDKGEKKNKAVVILVSLFLSVVILLSVFVFVISPIIKGDPTRKLNESIYPLQYESCVEKNAKRFDVDVCLVFGVIKTESSFDPNAVSPAGAIGLMQLMPDTFTWLQNYRTDFLPDKILDSSELYKPEVNVEYGTYLLRYLLDRYDGDRSLAIIAYNAGYGNVDNWLADGTITKGSVTSATIPFTETANYLDRVTTAADMYKQLYYSDTDFLTSPDAEPESVTAEDASSGEEPVYSQSEYAEDQYSDSNETYTSEYYNDVYAYEGDGTGLGYGDDYGDGENYGYQDYQYDENNGEW